MIVFCLFVVVIMLMMDCAKKTMKKKTGEGGETQGWRLSDAPDGYRSAALPFLSAGT